MEFGKIHCIVKCAKIRRDKLHFVAVGAYFFAVDVKKKTKSGWMGEIGRQIGERIIPNQWLLEDGTVP